MWFWSLVFLLNISCEAAEVAFIEYHNPDGSRVELEPGGRFMHAAIRYKKSWLHAHSYRGVQLIRNPLQYGHVMVTLKHDQVPEPSWDAIRPWINKPFDFSYSPINEEATYCSRLIAELLGVPPQPMSFRADHWSKASNVHIGYMGWSPDDLYRALLERGFVERGSVENCEAKLL